MFRPKIIGFICNWSLPTDVEITSPQGVDGYPKCNIVRLACAGRIDPVILLETFIKGADGVLVVGCPSPDCHYVEGNVQAEGKIRILKKLLSLTGLQPSRLRLEWAYVTDIEAFARIVDDFRNQVTRLGESPLAGKIVDEKILTSVLAAKNAAGDFRLRLMTGREEDLAETANVYGELLPKGEFDDVLEKVIEEEFIRHKIQLLARQKPISVRELGTKLDLDAAMILSHIVEMRRKGMITLDHVENTTPLYKALEVEQA
jgi:F420-non-reducing hydrogenase iron-sulfur subunit